MNSYYQLIMKITIFQNRTVAKLGKKGKISISVFQDIVIFQWKKFSILKKAPIKESVPCFYGDWNQGCDWFI